MSMPVWKLKLFVFAIQKRMIEENQTAEEIINEYPKLTDEEKAEIFAALQR